MFKELLEREVYQGFKAKQMMIYTVIAYGGYRVLKYVNWRFKNLRLTQRSKSILNERNAKTYKFKEVESEELILSLPDVQAIRENLLKQMFTIEDLVTVYARRCVEIGRKLNLTTVENIDEAL